jgi:hypothetical protein
MTTLQITLPDQLAHRAGNAGLLTNSALEALLEDAMRREAGRKLLPLLEILHSSTIEPSSEAEIIAEIKAARVESRSAAS